VGASLAASVSPSAQRVYSSMSSRTWSISSGDETCVIFSVPCSMALIVNGNPAGRQHANRASESSPR
jgi:hypothetical protein